MKKYFIILISIFMSIFLVTCNSCAKEVDKLFDAPEHIKEDGCNYLIYKKYCSIAAFDLNINEEENYYFTVPEYYNGLKVTKLGGYLGRGYPEPFGAKVIIDKNVYNYNNITPFDTDNINLKYYENKEYDIKKLYISIGNNIEEFYNCLNAGSYYIGINPENNKQHIIFKLEYNFIISPTNKYFYSQDGKVYDKETNELVELK